MPIRLEDGDIDVSGDLELLHSIDHSKLTRAVNGLRISNIPALNFIIIWILGTFLVKLTTKYTALYLKNSLITIIVTNLVLYGISETLAQSILNFKPNQPIISFKMHEPAILHLASDATENHLPHAEEIEFNRFIEFIQEPQIITTESQDYETIRNTPVTLTFFNFKRLAGFMCWGFIMAFVQCWWYKFLQIYSKDPKFIEVLRKVLTDQLLYSPISLFCFFTYGTMVLEYGSWNDAKVKMSKIYLKTLMANFTVWFPVQFINFLIVPRNYQVPFSSSISVLWNCYLSMKNSSG
ncbi:uncharacterized protein PRCAT00001099001 [Priceomyces carsonii]|uniref:uncharacterized protein n=1 Tax=Priceomyces carsonii TaxID=28549 RepID=UPI002ED799C5|nr:unnamed protein product [Priceomyces carsonii]